MWTWHPTAGYRNARGVRLGFRPVGAPYEPYPPWVRALEGVSGVYVIRLREARGPHIVYVGESHLDRLYGTLTRHFQRWTPRRRGSPHRYSAHDPGLVYPRARCDAAAIVTPANRAVDIQNALILWLRPRDNIVGAAREDEPVEDVGPTEDVASGDGGGDLPF